MQRQYAKKVSPVTIRRMFLFAGVPLFSLCATLLLFYVLAPARIIPTSAPAGYSAHDIPPASAIGVPIRLVITRLSIDTAIRPAGLTGEGDMAIDDTIDEVAWYQQGPSPGQEGSAVIAGHYGWKDGAAAVFTMLHTLRAGDKITIHDVNDETRVFIVRILRSYLPEANATDVFKSDDGKAHLNLITCKGAWDSSLNSYPERLVVFTDQES